jgi:hypothetical protein
MTKCGIDRPYPPLPPASETFDKEAKARFWRKVSPGPADACWIWHGASNAKGYGNVGRKVGARKVTYLAHRVAYEVTHGPVPSGLDLDHTCRNKRCVNPGHLEPVTFLANMRRRYAEKPDERDTHCLRGHEYTAENTAFISTTGQRKCRTCYPNQSREVS